MALPRPTSRFLFPASTATLSLLLLLHVATFATFATAASHVLLPFSRHVDTTSGPSRVSARDSSGGSEAVSVVANEFTFVVNATVGTPGQPVLLKISPSAIDTWVPDANGFCDRRYYDSTEYDDTSYEYYRDPVCRWGAYNTSLSSTYLPPNQKYQTFSVGGYGFGSEASGDNCTDLLVVGDIAMDDYPLGVASEAALWIGVLGLGMNVYDSSYYTSYMRDYPTFINRMVASGKIATPAYSIWLDKADASSGKLLFGAVDTSKFEGDLVSLYAVNDYVLPGSFGVELYGVNGTTGANSASAPIVTNDFPLGVTISPGDTFSKLPAALAKKIMTMAGATYNRTLGMTTIPCDAAATNTASFSFQLGGPDGPFLEVQLADLIVPSTVFAEIYVRGDLLAPANICLFGIQNSTTSSSSSSSSYYDTYANLGSSMLRRTYTVFDLVNQQIAVAPVKFGSDSSTIVAFDYYGATAPSSTQYCADDTCTTSSGCSTLECVSPGDPSSTYTYSPTATARATHTFSPISPTGSSINSSGGVSLYWRNIAIGVGVSLGVVALVGLIAATVLWNRNCFGSRKDAAGKEKDMEVDGGESADSAPPSTAQQQQQQQPASTAAAVAAAAALGASGSRKRSLTVITEGEERVGSSSGAQGAPQLPGLPSQLAEPMMTPARPHTPSNRDSIAVSTVSAEEETGAGSGSVPAPHAGDVSPVPSVAEPVAHTGDVSPVPPRSPKGKEIAHD
ncbi:aspartic peptidase domain-containing protein [Cercophora scortea]|uniref:Aspartic peptidase domain-containing protein n=1 Tax=Cercophora scortea TaxID=314031 RepID=A0AAE0IV26_9PEZI|nr:aspartic peptidase domain-containing protein [Cercophora scortea]